MQYRMKVRMIYEIILRDVIVQLEDLVIKGIYVITNDYIPKIIGGYAPCKDCGMDCGRNGADNSEPCEQYMVYEWIWAEAHMKETTLWGNRGWLCIECLESRIGRKLESSDFIDFPINWDPDIRRSPRLMSRLGL